MSLSTIANPDRGRAWIVTRSVSFRNGVGGMERAVSDQALALAALGWEVTVVAPFADDDEIPESVHPINVPWLTGWATPGAPGFGLAYLLWVRRVRRVLRREMPPTASLYLHGGAAGVLRGLNRVHDARTVANPHGMEEFTRGGFLRWTNRVFTRHLSRGARLADVVVSTDATLTKSVAQNIGATTRQIALIPNAINVERLDNLATLNNRNVQSTDIVSVGRLTFNKGYDLLLEAIRSIEQSTGQRLTWAHYGRGALLQELELSAAQGESKVDVKFIQDADDATVQSAIAQSRVFVQPSRYEGSSLTTLEGMARSAICVGTPVGGIPEKITDGETGFLADAATSADIQAAILRALSADREIGLRARQRVLESYDLPVVARQLSNALTPSEGASVRVQQVIQVARHIGTGAGVAQVVHSLENAFAARKVTTQRITLENTGLKFRTQIGKSPIQKMKLLVEVVWFSIAGTVLAKRAARNYPDAAILVHGDPIGGDAYVNHGLLKEVVRRRRETNRYYIPINPMHWFTLLRDELRYSSARQRSIVCLTEEDRSTLYRLYPRIKVPVSVIPNGVDLERFTNLDQHRSPTRAELGIPETASVLLFVGHEYERKGLYVLFEALTRLESSTFALIVGGSTEMVEEAQATAQRLGIRERVILVGAIADPLPFFAAADMLVLPTIYETGPLVLLEALAAGKMVVTTTTGIAPKVIESGVNGELVERRADSVAQGVRECQSVLARDREEAQRACIGSVQGYGWDTIAAQYLELLQKATPADGS